MKNYLVFLMISISHYLLFAQSEVKYNEELMAELEIIKEDDQKYRRELHELLKKFDNNSDEVKSIWVKINKTDSTNLIKVKKILDEHGWPGKDIVNDRARIAIFNVIQHSDLETQEKYLPILKQAIDDNIIFQQNIAMLEDRILAFKGKNQIYGTQIITDPETNEKFVAPLFDPENVNKRRNEIGLGNIEDYLKSWGIIWNVENYKENIPRYKNIVSKINTNK